MERLVSSRKEKKPRPRTFPRPATHAFRERQSADGRRAMAPTTEEGEDALRPPHASFRLLAAEGVKPSVFVLGGIISPCLSCRASLRAPGLFIRESTLAEPLSACIQFAQSDNHSH